MKINKKYYLMPVLIISMILFLYSNCYANTGCEHKYGEIKYTWSSDNLECTAERRCTRCNEVESETADAMISIIQLKNCIYPEVAIFEVIFDNAAFEPQTKRVQTAEAMGHEYGEIEYTWSTDNLKCTAKGKCRRCNEVKSETADAEASIVQERNCTLPELTTYSVTFENSAFGTQTKERVQTAEAAGHTWKYEVDAKSSNQINAHCTETKYQEECEYQKSTATLTLNAEDIIYTGKEYDKASVINNISSITGATCGEIYYEGTNYKKSTVPPTNPGTYTASVTIGGATATKTFTISKLDSTFTAPTAKKLTYDGTEQELVNSGQTEHGKLWYRLKDGGTWQEGTVPKAKDAKKYTVLYYLEGDTTHKDVGSQSDPAGSVEVTIEPKDITATITPNGGTYGNVTKATVALDGVVEDDKDAVAVDLRYSGQANDGSTVTDSVKVPEKAGSYTVATGTVSNTNYKLKGDSKPFTIAKAKVSAPSISSKEYTGEIQTADIKETPLYEVKENKGGAEAGSYDVVLSLKDAANYTWEATKEKELKVSFTITRASNIWKTDPAVKGWTYGESHETPVAEPMYGKDTLVVEYRPADAEDSAYTTEEPKDAGDYKVRFTVAETESYGSLSKVLEFTIQKAAKEAPKVTAVPETVKGQGNGQITGVDSSMEYRKDGDKDYTAITGENVTGLQAGTYFVRYKESKNYKASKEAEVIIAAGTQLTITLPSNQEGYTLTVDKNVIDWHEEATLTFTLKEGYTKIEDFAVLVNGKKVELNAKNSYVIRDIETNMEVTVTGVKLNGNTIEKRKRPLLLAKGKGRNKRITLSWLRYSRASGYEVYWSYCNGEKNYKKFATVRNNKLKVTHKKLKNNRDYKYYIVAYRMENGKKIYLAKSNVLHVAMKQSKFTNAKSITLNKKKVTLKVNKTFKIRAKVKLESKKKKQVLHGKAYRYYTDNSNVATVSKKGVITAKAKGNCSIYVLTNNGVYKKIKVTVK